MSIKVTNEWENFSAMARPLLVPHALLSTKPSVPTTLTEITGEREP